MKDALDRLSEQVYGRPAEPSEYLGGSEAQILDNAATMLAELRAQQEAAHRQIARYQRALGAVRELIHEECDWIGSDIDETVDRILGSGGEAE